MDRTTETSFWNLRLYNPVIVNLVDSRIRIQNCFDKLNIFLMSRVTLRYWINDMHQMGYNSTRLCAKHGSVRDKQKWSTNTKSTGKALDAMVNYTAHKLMVQIKCDFHQISILKVFLKNRTLLDRVQRSLTTLIKNLKTLTTWTHCVGIFIGVFKVQREVRERL